MDAADGAPRDAPAKWSFHTMIVASGASAVETTSRTQLLAALAVDTQLAVPSDHHNSYRIVRRQEVEETVKMMRVETLRAEREAVRAAATAARISAGATHEKAATEAPPQSAGDDSHLQDEEIDVGIVSHTPVAMAMAFQRLVALDKQAFVEAGSASSEATAPLESAAARIFLLVDYPSTVPEAQALLLTGEAGQTKPHQFAAGLPLLPLLDGVLLVVDPTRELRERRKSLSQTDERRKSLARHISTEGKDAAELADKQLATTSVFQTANPFVRDLYECAAGGGLEWSDLVFVDLACCSSVNDVKPAAELVRDMETTVATRVSEKMAFKEWVSSVRTVELPTTDDASAATQAIIHTYEEVLGSVFEPSVGVVCVLWAMREAVACTNSDVPQEDIAHTLTNDNNASLPEAFIEHGDHAALALALSYDCYTKEAVLLQERPLDPCYVRGERIDTIERAIWMKSDLPGVGNQGRKFMPVHPRLSQAERSVLDTEYATFAAVPVPRVHLMRQLLRFEEVLGQPWKGKLQTRTVTESLTAEVLPQRLASVLRENPTVFKDYDEPTDSLLVAAIFSTAPGRFRTTSWTARDHVRHRPSLKDWHREKPPPEEYLTPRTAFAATACVPLSAGQLAAVSEKCSIAYPADQSIIRLIQTTHAPAWVSVSLDGDVFGLRPRPSVDASTKLYAMQFYANLVDGSQVLIREGRERPKKPDGNTSISATVTSRDGLIVTTCSDGTIIQQRHQAVAVSKDNEKTETYRVISGKGAIVCVMSDGSRRILLSNGDVVTRSGPKSSPEPLSDPIESTHRELIIDPETNAVIEKRIATGVVVVTQSDGSRVTYHTDGTTISATATRSHVLITKRGLADVCIDVDVNLAAHRHSNGEKVAVTKGGLRTRSTVRLDDGTEVQIQYNTKVVAEVNGRIVVATPDGTQIVAKDSGRVEFTSRRTAAARSRQTESDEDADRDELSHIRIYYFNCRDGSMSLVDHEQNLFRVDVGDGRGLPTVRIDLAGVLSENDAEKYELAPIPARAVINDPIEPYLFVLNGDGTGRELLRPRDVRDYFGTEAQSSGYVSEVSPLRPPSPLSATGGEWWTRACLWEVGRVFVQQIRPDPRRAAFAQRQWFDDDKLTACFERLKTPIATAFCLMADPCLPPLSIPDNQFTLVRHVQQLRPMTSDDVTAILATVDKWREWQTAREANKDRFKVVDPRDADALALEASMQRKVIAAYKATRARKKAERQKQRELQRKSRAASGGVTHMETVQEGDEPQDGDKVEDEEDELDQIFSEGTDEESHSDIDVEVDDPDELMWTAFSQADKEDTGRLAFSQVRQALVQVLGVGVTTADLSRLLHSFKQPEPFAISFDVFVDLVHAFRGEQDDLHGDSHGDDAMDNNSSPVAPHTRQLAAGSATEAVRSFSLLRLNPSSPVF